MLAFDQARTELSDLLRTKSVFHGDFTLSSGARSNYYLDCRLTTLDPKGAWLVGQTMHTLIRKEQAARNARLDAVGGLTMGADPIGLAVGMFSYWVKETAPLHVFSVRKAPKGHGQTKLIEGNFRKVKEGGTVAFVAVLVDRQEGGREKIETLGHAVVSLFKRDELLEVPSPSRQRTNFVVA